MQRPTRRELRRERDDAGIVDRGGAEIHERRGAARDLDRAAVVEPHDRRRRVPIGHECRDLAGRIHRERRRERQIGAGAERVGARHHGERAVDVDAHDGGHRPGGVVDRDDTGVVDHDGRRAARAQGVGEVEERHRPQPVGLEDDPDAAVRGRIEHQRRKGDGSLRSSPAFRLRARSHCAEIPPKD